MRPQNIGLMKTQTQSALAINSVLRKTYLLLSLTLLFSAVAAGYAVMVNARPMGILPLLIGMFGLYFLINALKNSIFGLFAIFAFTGFMGYTLGPVLNFYIHSCRPHRGERSRDCLDHCDSLSVILPVLDR